jgi:hypothetical protein
MVQSETVRHDCAKGGDHADKQSILFAVIRHFLGIDNDLSFSCHVEKKIILKQLSCFIATPPGTACSDQVRISLKNA